MAETEQSNVDYSNLIRAQTRQVDIDAFKERGMKKVNVINARKINELISQAVTNIIGKMEDADIETIKDDKAKIVMDSMSEFKRLFSEQKKEQEQQNKLQEELQAMREQMAQQQSAAPAASSMQLQGVTDEIAELKAFIISQSSKAQSSDMTRQAMMEQQQELLEDHFNDLKAALATSGNASAQAAVSEDNTKKALEETVEKMTKLLEEQESKRNGATTDAIMKALGEMREDLGKRFEDLTNAVKETAGSKSENDAKTLKEELSSLREELKSASTESMKTELASLRDDIKNANASELKAEIAALRDDLAEKTVAAGAANTEALQAQMAQMQELLEKGGGGGGGGNIDMSALADKLEGSLSKRLAAAGIGKEEVSMDDAMAASSVMLGAAFKGMDNIESNIGSMDANKVVDKKGAKKAKGALDALKKLKGKG
ncbi:MAG: hypothetical protein KDB29_02185 [Planctomycetes bacterium]|nr:hypothetical protein [Planctomycetota bacterium]